MLRGIRGAVQVAANTHKDIFSATQELLAALLERNALEGDSIASVFLTATTDLNAAFPAHAARAMRDWNQVPLLCAQEMHVPGSMPRVVRVLVQVNTDKPQAAMQHVYLGDTRELRPDLA